MDANKKKRKRRVRRSSSLHLSIHHEPRDPPDIDKLAKLLIDLARNLDAHPNDIKTDQVSSAEETSGPPAPPDVRPEHSGNSQSRKPDA